MHKNFHKKAPSWSKLQSWFLDKLSTNDGGISPINKDQGDPNRQSLSKNQPELDYQVFLENASKSMIRFKKPEHLIRMIVKNIDEQVRVTHTAVLLYKEARDSYILIDSKGEEGLKIPIGFIRLVNDNPLISLFNERNNYLISETGTLIYEDVIRSLKNKIILENDPELYDKLLAIKRQLDLLRANICVPCYFKRDLLGILILGDKLSGEKFNRQELGFFITLANDTAMAITNAQLIESLQQKVEEIKELYNREHRIFIHTAIALAAAIDARDPYTHGHTERVTNYCLAVAQQLEGVPEIGDYPNFKETLHIAALLHDVGKIGVPDHILNKNTMLTPEEFAQVKKHSEIGATIIKPIKELGYVAREVRHHQEAYDGSGYPDGLKGDEIPFIARIIAVADTFDAMTTDRPYRKKHTAVEAIQELEKCAGTQFEPVVVSALILAYEKGHLFPHTKNHKNNNNRNHNNNKNHY